MKLEGKRVLVTGASGFIGGRLAERLASETGARVRGLVRKPAPGLESSLDVALGDMTNASAVAAAVQGCDIIVHCAAKQLPPGTRAQFITENVSGLENLARAALDQRVDKFVHLSTINVHGFRPPKGCNAESPFRLTGDAYSDSKVVAEQVAWKYCHEKGLPLVVVRPACTFGPHGGAWTITPLARVRAGKRVLLGDGSFLCNSVYADNLIDLILLAIEKDNAVGQAFIGSDGVGVSWREFYGAYARMLNIEQIKSVPLSGATAVAWLFELVARATGTRPRVSMQSVRFYSHRIVYDISKARQLLGYTPRVSFEEGMRRTEQWLTEQGLV